MTRYAVSAALIAVNLAFLAWFASRHPLTSATLLVAVLIAVVASAIVERAFFGTDGGWRARLDPKVALAFVLAFDLALLAAILLKR